VFSFAWAAYFPSGFDATFQALSLLLGSAVVTGSIGALFLTIRPVTGWWHLGALMPIGVVGGVISGRLFADSLITDCLHGTGPQPQSCDHDYSMLPLTLHSVGAALLLALVVGIMGVRPSGEDRAVRLL
jgi:hypothetical protein